MELKAILIGVAVLALACGGYWAYRSAYDAGDKAGAARVQVLWDADKASIQQVTAAALAKVNADKDAALQANEVIENELQAQLSAANASAGELAQRLRNAQSSLAANRSQLPKAGGGSNAAAATSDPGLGPIDDAIAGALAECAANRARQVALIGELKPQLN
jgi:hypothetical protein